MTENGVLLQEEIEEERCSPFKQVIAVSGCTLNCMVVGMAIGFSAILFPQLQEEGSIQVSLKEKSLLASIVDPLRIMGSTFAGWSLNRFGRRNTMIFNTSLFITSWAIISSASSVRHFLVGRVLCGFCLGCTNSVQAFFIGEVSHPHYREFFMTVICAAVSFGVLFVNLAGTFATWKTASLLSLGASVVTLVAFCLPPESHIYYVNKNKFEEAKKSFRWFRGDNSRTRKEWNKIYMDQVANKKPSFRKLLSDCRSTGFTKPLCIALLLYVTCEMSAYKTFVFYCVDIMRLAVPHIDAYVAMISIDVIRTVVSVLTCLLMKKFKVRPLVITSGIGTAMSLLGMALFQYLSVNYPTKSSYFNILTTTSLIAYVIFINVGLMDLPWVITSELFNADTKAVAAPIIVTVDCMTSFAVVYLNPTLTTSIGSRLTFTIYAVLTLLGTAVLALILPETRNKTLKEIEQHFI